MISWRTGMSFTAEICFRQRLKTSWIFLITLWTTQQQPMREASPLASWLLQTETPVFGVVAPHWPPFCLRLLPHESYHMWAQLRQQTAAQSCVQCLFNIYSYWTCPNRTKVGTTLSSVLGDKPAKCEEDRLNSSQDIRGTDGQIPCLYISIEQSEKFRGEMSL